MPNVFCAGEPTGIAGLEAALVQGEIAGLACAGRSGALLEKRAASERAFGDRMEKAFALRDELHSLPRPDTIVCRCEDVAFGSLRWLHRLDRCQAADALRHGSVPGPHLRPCCGVSPGMEDLSPYDSLFFPCHFRHFAPG